MEPGTGFPGGAGCDPVGGVCCGRRCSRFILSCPDPLGLTKAIEPKLWVKGGGARFTRFHPGDPLPYGAGIRVIS
jgi:hypothetical protein